MFLKCNCVNCVNAVPSDIFHAGQCWVRESVGTLGSQNFVLHISVGSAVSQGYSVLPLLHDAVTP